MNRISLVVAAAVAVLASAASVPAPASGRSATWCGGVARSDLPDVLTSYQWHVVYAVPSDGSDRLTTVAPWIVADLTAVDRWWQQQDPTRTPRFDLFQSGCAGLAALDITDVRLPQTAAAYAQAGYAGRDVGNDLNKVPFDSTKKYLVYYDGHVPGPVCGDSTNMPTSGNGKAIVYVANDGSGGTTNCGPFGTGDWSALIAAHVMLGSMGAGARDAPHGCPGDLGHFCDSDRDILAPYGVCCGIFDRTLDVGHDDYYAHNGAWWDVQDSKWLRRLENPPAQLEVKVVGGVPGASVTSDGPGVDCSADCTSTWDQDTAVTLTAHTPDGYELRSWSGACSGDVVTCTLTIGASNTVTATFGRGQTEVDVVVKGRGSVTSAPAGIACSLRCGAKYDLGSVVSFAARSARGYRFVGWSGGCTGRAERCRVTVSYGTDDVVATFRRR